MYKNKLGNDVFDSVLKIAFYENAKKEFDTLPPKEELDKLYAPTQKDLRFAKRKDKEIKYNKPLYLVYLRRTVITLLLLASLALLLIFISSDIRNMLLPAVLSPDIIQEEIADIKAPCEIIEENGNLYLTVDGVKQTHGLYEAEGEYYYAHSDGVLARNGVTWITNNNSLPINEAYYRFDNDGKLVKTGFVEAPTGHTYYYKNCVGARGLTKIGDDYYFFNESSGGMYRDIYAWVGSDNSSGYREGYYYFLSDGKMFIPSSDSNAEIIQENGSYYYTVDSIKLTNGIYTLDGEYYYAKSDSVLCADSTVWIPHTMALEFGGEGGYYAFDSEARLIRTGFVTTPEGHTYYRNNNALSKGVYAIGEDYYFFNKSSGSMYRDSYMWISEDNAYGFDYGYYYFDREGKMQDN